MATIASKRLRKSKGHIGFHTYADGEIVEFYRAGDDIYRAPIGNEFDVRTGRRIGRFESTEHAWPLLLRILGGLNDA